MFAASRTLPLLIGATGLALSGAASAAKPDMASGSPLAGTWTLMAAEVLHPNGSRENDYGEAPKGLFIVDADGRYSLQILKSERRPFASPSKAEGTPAEFEQAVLGSSTHFGVVQVNDAEHTLSFFIEGSSFPNWEGETQTRSFELSGDVLSYKVPPRPNGDIPISIWRRQ